MNEQIHRAGAVVRFWTRAGMDDDREYGRSLWIHAHGPGAVYILVSPFYLPLPALRS